MKLSIIIVSFNTKKLTLDCVNSIFKFASSGSYEVIVSDNGSTDGSVESLKKLQKTRKNTLKILENGSNLGFAAGNNIAIKQAKGEYVLLLNSDTKLINNVLDELINFAEETPDAGVVAPKLLNADESLQSSIYRTPTIWRAFSQYYLGRKNLLDKYGLTNHEPTEVEVVVGAAFLITPKALKKVGMMDERYFMYFEDFDYCRRVRASGLKIYYLPCSYIVHIHGASGKGGVNNLLVESSKKYFGTMQYYLYTFILWTGQKFQKIFS